MPTIHGLSTMAQANGIPPVIVMDGSKEQTLGKFQRKPGTAMVICIKWTEPYSPWQNAASWGRNLRAKMWVVWPKDDASLITSQASYGTIAWNWRYWSGQIPPLTIGIQKGKYLSKTIQLTSPLLYNCHGIHGQSIMTLSQFPLQRTQILKIA